MIWVICITVGVMSVVAIIARLKVVKCRVALECGKKIPWGYGVAWREDYAHRIVCYPIPLNIVFSYLRRFYWLMASGPWNFCVKKKCTLSCDGQYVYELPNDCKFPVKIEVTYISDE